MSRRAIQAEDLLKLQFVGDPQLSPDGANILFSKKHIGEKNKYVTNLYTVCVKTGELKQWTQGENGAGHGRWSPDGSQIAFISGRDKPGAQLYLIPTAGGEAKKLTSFPEGSLGGFAWSPDGTKIAITFREAHKDRTTKAGKEREEKGLSTPPWEIDDVWYRLDGDGYFGPQRYKIYIVDVATGEHKALYDKSKDGNYNFDWLPDSSGLVVAHNQSKNLFFEEPNDNLVLVPLKGKAEKFTGLPKGSIGTVRVSPDGKTVAYLGDVNLDDPWGVRNTKLYVVPMGGGDPKCLTGEQDYCLSVATLSDTAEGVGSGGLKWIPDGKNLVVNVGWHGEGHLGLVDAKKGGVKLITSGKMVLGFGSIGADGSMACTHSVWNNPGEIAIVEAGTTEPRVLTDYNGPLMGKLDLSEPEGVWLESTDDVKIQAWVMQPSTNKSKGKHPAILEIHGGPHCQYGVGFFHEFQVLVAEGYVVVYSNPRGSKGYGEKHCAAIRGDWGNKDWDDIQAVLNHMMSLPFIDSKKMGVMGGSYGGYMTNWVVGHTTDFKAAITDRCVSNMVSMAGSSDFPFNKDGYFGGYPWGDLKAIESLWKQSPIAYFDKVKTPMLIIHSEGDLRCNIEQSEQVFYALKAQGIETRFVRYPVSTSHGMSRGGPADLRLHRLGEITSWWKKHLD